MVRRTDAALWDLLRQHGQRIGGVGMPVGDDGIIRLAYERKVGQLVAKAVVQLRRRGGKLLRRYARRFQLVHRR